MKIVLTKTVRELGRAGEIVNVSDAYARNYLLPQKLAVPASTNAVAAAQATVAQQTAAREKRAATATAARTKLTGMTLRLSGGASPAGRLYQAIHAEHLVAAIKQQLGVTVEGVVMEPAVIKHTGRQPVTLVWPDRSKATLAAEVEPA